MYLKDHLLALNGAFNVRDLGGYEANDQQTQWRRFLRADNLTTINENDKNNLRQYGLKTVIDLRSDDELSQAPDPFQQDADVHYHHISLFANLNPEEFIHHESPLTSFYLGALSQNGSAFASIFNIMANATRGTILFHCTLGKDRTGLVAALLLLNAGVAQNSIIEDYILTDKFIKPLVSNFMKTANNSDINIEKYKKALECNIPAMYAVLNAINDHYKGIENWFDYIGIDQKTQIYLTKRLLKEHF